MSNNLPNVVSLGDQQSTQQQALVAIESARSTQEVMASMLAAKRFPRDEKLAIDKIMNACDRAGLAAEAIYSFPKGGSTVEGPSIRLAECIKQYWGNIDSGWRELERRGFDSIVQAYAWDKETNTRAERVFTVKQSRSKKEFGQDGKPTGKTINSPITDERDIYENNANQAARRMRACILELIPGDIIEDAVVRCAQTLAIKEKVTPETIKAMLEGFAVFGVTKAMVEERLGRKIESLQPAMMVKLRSIYKSLKDGVAKVPDFFIVPVIDATAPATKKDEKKAAKKKPEPESEEVTEDGEVIETSAEEENKDQLEGFKEKQAAKKAVDKPAAKSSIVKKPLPPVEFPKDQDGYPVDSGKGDPE